jgi:hypothetical protein
MNKTTILIGDNERDNIKVWGAEIVGKSQQYGFERNFISYSNVSSTSAKHLYKNTYMDCIEGGVYEMGMKSAYKNKRYYFTIRDGKKVEIGVDEVMKIVEALEFAKQTSKQTTQIPLINSVLMGAESDD